MPNLQIIIILLVVVAPILKQLYDKAQEQKELQRRQRDRTVSQRETLRTGRQPEDLIGQRSGAQGFDERARLHQLEADRLARIRAMREASARSAGGRAAPGQQAGATTAQAAEARRAQELAARRRAALEAQQRQAQLQAQQRQAQARAQAQAKRSPAAGQRQTRVVAPAQRVETVKPAPDPVQAERRPASTFPKAGAVTATRGDAIAREMGTRAGVRRAIVMSEILRPPLALRSTQDADAAWKA